MTCAEVGKNKNWAYGKALQTGELLQKGLCLN